MERYDVSEGARLAEMVEAAEHGSEVELTRDGEVVAKVIRSVPASKGIEPGKLSAAFDPKSLANVHAITRSWGIKDAAALVREMRDEGY